MIILLKNDKFVPNEETNISKSYYLIVGFLIY
ncbi:hypothetical protein predicted by Glimmer/Critica [Lactococcus cremoris subsp. cremoris MG1363]|uniref:Uncharacterized protein n=1 Tax=Lactococcus lactis subsp. cremoris (strain MG1363) TaxID=416870 RepID=A2RIE5_LACLM|nr:hypothetical protein predicted by Glimmer/Critica [Lactococcus cremoris subsp. cremoris MG1363]